MLLSRLEVPRAEPGVGDGNGMEEAGLVQCKSWGKSDNQEGGIHQSRATLLLLVNIPSKATGCPVVQWT